MKRRGVPPPTDHVPDTELPEFQVILTPTVELDAEALRRLLMMFRAGCVEPLIFGDGGQPEAAIIPFPDLVRLMSHDHAVRVLADHHDRMEIARRIRHADAHPEESVTLEELFETPPFDDEDRAMLRRLKAEIEAEDAASEASERPEG